MQIVQYLMLMLLNKTRQLLLTVIDLQFSYL